MKHIVFSTIFLMLFLYGSSQNSLSKKELNNLTKKGDKYLLSGDNQSALDCFLKLYNAYPLDANINYKIGKCYMNISKKNATYYLFNAFNNFKDSDNAEYIKDNMLLLASALQYNYQFDSAIIILDSLSRFTDPTFNYLLSQCKTGDSLLRYPSRYVVKQLNNLEWDEFMPILHDSTIFFNSTRHVDSKKKSPANTILKAILKTDTVISQLSEANKILNASKNSIITDISKDGKYILFTKNGDIYFSKKNKDGKYEKPSIVLGTINTAFEEKNACFTPDMQYIYFSSNCEGGKGGFDIYKAKVSFNVFGELVCYKKTNLGEKINSAYNEISVSFSDDYTNMYVSSDCEKSMGGYDIFKSFAEGDSWSTLTNLGFPLNTPEDEMCFTIKNNVGYFTKIDGNYRKNIYSVSMVNKARKVLLREFENSIREPDAYYDNITFGMEDELKISSYVMNTVRGKILDARDSSSAVSIKADVIDNKTLHVIASFESQPKTGKFSISLPSGNNYGLLINDSIYRYCSQEFIVNGSSSHKIIENNIYLVPFNKICEIRLENIFFSKNQNRLNYEKSKSELFRLAQLLTKDKKLRVEFTGMLSLTSKVMAYLINEGIEGERIKRVNKNDAQFITAKFYY